MAIYTVHRFVPIEASGGEREAFSGERDIFVKEAFAWPAFFFTGFWAFTQRMWWVGLVLLAVLLMLDGGLAMLGIDAYARAVVLFGYLLSVGCFANDWRRAWLARRGFVFVGVASGAGLEEATRRYYDHAQ